REGLIEVKSPLLGIFYHAPKPGEPPFVRPGDRVEEETVIGIIEVMKLMNSARAGVTGEVVEIIAPNGELIEHGQVLMLVRPDA
ncbi:MAG: accB 2, partial [Sphingomonas bacterium]